MYTIQSKIFQDILKKKFKWLVGNLCEQIEMFAHEKKIAIESKEVQALIKIVKDYSYDAMRGVGGQVDAFSKGVNINVKFIRPNSE